MADNITLNSGTGGAVLAADDITSVWYQIVKLAHGALDSATLVSTASGLPVQQQGTWNIGTVTTVTTVSAVTAISNALPAGDNNVGNVDIVTVPAPLNVTGTGTEATALRVTLASDSTGVLSVDDNGAALSIDDGGNVISIDWNGTAPPIGAGTEAAALRVTIATDSTGVLSVDDNAGALTVDNAGTFAVQNTPVPADKDITTHTNYIKKYYTASTPTDGIVWSPGAGKRWHVTSLFIGVSAAATVTLEDDLAGGDSAVWAMALAANSGVHLVFPSEYPLASGEDAADLILTSTAGTVYCTAVGYEI